MIQKISELKIDGDITKSIQTILPPLSIEEYRGLKNSIINQGIQHPILITQDNQIIDGWHRLKIAKELGIKQVNVEVRNLPEKEAIELGCSVNIDRRHLSFEQQIEILKKLRKQKAEIIKYFREKGLTQKEIEEKTGIPDSTISDVEKRNISNSEIGNAYISDLRYTIPKYTEEIIAKRVESGEKQSRVAADFHITQARVSQIVRKVKARRRKPTPPDKIDAPSKIYKTLVIDPPWPIKKIERDVRPDQGQYLDYPTMTIDEIKALPISKWVDPTGAHIYLWTTHKFLPVAFEVFKEWKVKYQCLLTWVKDVGFTPFSWMYSTEHVLFGRIGSLDLLKKGKRLDFRGKVREHSRKPDEFYDLIKEVSPGPRLDVFSREKRDGFDQWGNEKDKF